MPPNTNTNFDIGKNIIGSIESREERKKCKEKIKKERKKGMCNKETRKKCLYITELWWLSGLMFQSIINQCSRSRVQILAHPF